LTRDHARARTGGEASRGVEVLELLRFDCAVSWPACVVIGDRQMQRYNAVLILLLQVCDSNHFAHL
jgi:hypothetical protein